MASRFPINLFSGWPAIKSLRNRIRRVLPLGLGHRKLKMRALETQRLTLRRFEQNDFKDVIAWEESTIARNMNVEARQFLDYCFREYREEGFGPWGMQWKETGVIVGNCGFPHVYFDEHCAEINYYVAVRYRGQGIAVEAVKALLQFGFRDWGMTKIQARCDPENFASERVMQKAGMKFEGLIEHAPRSRGPAPRQKLYAIQAKDFVLSPDGAQDGDADVPARPGGCG